MSFIIALCIGSEARIAADSRISCNGVAIQENYNKIDILYGNGIIYVGYGGTKELAEIVLKKVKNSSSNNLSVSSIIVPNTIETYAHQILNTSNDIVKSQNLDTNKFQNKYILISRANQTNYLNPSTNITAYATHVYTNPPLFEIYYIDTKENSVQQLLVNSNQYAQVYANSRYISTEIVDEIISRNLKIQVSIDEKIENIIKEVSKHDPSVNDNIKICKI